MNLADEALSKASDLRRQGKFEEAAGILRTLVDSDQGNAVARNDLGIVLKDLDRPEEAEDCLRLAVELAPESSQFRINLGLLKLQGQATEAAEESFAAAAKLAPGNAEALYWLGVALFRQDKLDAAERLLKIAVRVNASDWQLTALLGDVYRAQKKLAAAEKSIAKAAELFPENVDLWCRLSEVRLENEQYLAAERAAYRALGLEPENSQPLALLARVHFGMGKSTAALDEFRKLERLGHHDIRVLCGLGTALRSEGLIAESIETLRSAQKLRPDDGWVSCYLGTSYYSGGRFELAAACARRALETAGKTAPALFLLGGALEGLHLIHEARDCYAGLADLNPADWSARARLGWVLAEAEDLRGARRAYESVRPAINDDSLDFDADINLMRHFPVDKVYAKRKADPDRSLMASPLAIGVEYLSVNATGASLALTEDDPVPDDPAPVLDHDTIRANLAKLSTEIAVRLRDGPLALHRDNIKRINEITGRGPEPHVFVLSTGRCGTRSLFELLSMSSEITPYHNLWWMTAPEDRNHLLYRILTGMYDAKSLDAVVGTYLKCRMAEVLAAAASGRPVAMINHWDTVFAPVNAALHENARFIHLHRNPRDVFASIYAKSQWRGRQLQHVRFDRSFPNGTFWYRSSGIPIEANIAWYLRATECFAKAFAASVPTDRFLDLDADKLFAGDSAEIDRVCAFLPVGDLTPQQAHKHFEQKINAKDEYVFVGDSEIGEKQTAFERYWDQLVGRGRFGP